MAVPERFAAEAWTAPNRLAVVIEGRALSYGALYARARQAAARLAADSAHSQRVGLLLPNGAPFVVLLLAAMMAEKIPVILDPAWSEPELNAALAAAAPGRLFVAPELAARVAGRPDTVVLGHEASDSWLAWMGGPVARLAKGVPEAAPLFIGFTSGSAGRPKAYQRNHASWLASVEAARHEFGAASEGVLIPGPLAYSLSLYALIETLISGGTAHLMAPFRVPQALALLAGGGIRRLHGVPTQCAAIVEAADREGLTFPALTSVLVTGAALAPALRAHLRRIFPAAAVHSYYGASELSFVAVAKDGEPFPATAAGRPFRGVAVSIRREDGAETAVDEVGCLFVRSAFVCDGHLDGGEDTGFRMEDGWATVGDLAFRDAEGYLHLAGRHQGMLISGGRNVYPAEVEAVLARLPAVAEAVVLALPDAYWGDRVCAVIRWREGRRMSREELRSACRQQLAPWKVPQRFFAATEIPITSSGKVALARLRRQLQAMPPPHPEIP